MAEKDPPHTEPVIIHHLHWSGPYSPTEVMVRKNDWTEYPGIYQLYGTHPTEGENTLLYIGKYEGPLQDRIGWHKDNWLEWEFDQARVYLGRRVDEENLQNGEGDFAKDEKGMVRYPYLDQNVGDREALEAIETLLIYHASPPYNSAKLQTLNGSTLKREGTEPILLYNTGRIGKLPQEVSTLWWDRWFDIKKTRAYE